MWVFFEITFISNYTKKQKTKSKVGTHIKLHLVCRILTKNHFLEGDAVSALPQNVDMIQSKIGFCLHFHLRFIIAYCQNAI